VRRPAGPHGEGAAGKVRTVVAVYTGQGLIDPVKAVFAELLPECRLVNILDDGIIAELQGGGITPAIARRLTQYYHQAEDMGADVIFSTCSSVSEVAAAARAFVRVPIVQIDESMAEQAVSRYGAIGVLATLPTTLGPTVRLMQTTAARLGRQVSLVQGLAEGAYDALVAGRPEEHDRRLAETARGLADRVDALVLAQGSMARMEEGLAALTGRPVFSSPRLGVMNVRAVLERLPA